MTPFGSLFLSLTHSSVSAFSSPSTSSQKLGKPNGVQIESKLFFLASWGTSLVRQDSRSTFLRGFWVICVHPGCQLQSRCHVTIGVCWLKLALHCPTGSWMPSSRWLHVPGVSFSGPLRPLSSRSISSWPYSFPFTQLLSSGRLPDLVWERLLCLDFSPPQRRGQKTQMFRSHN